MHSKDMVKKAEHVDKKFDVGNIQTQLRFDGGDEAVLEIFQGAIIRWSCYPQRVLVPQVAETFPPSALVIAGPSTESRGRNAESGVGLNRCPQHFPSSLAICAPTCAAEELRA